MSPADAFPADQGRVIILNLLGAVRESAAYLSELDGAIGDGDHGINMSKGFTRAGERLSDATGLSEGLAVLGDTLLTEIGGAMGPLYGTFFLEMADACAGRATIDAATFGAMLDAGARGVQDLGDAKLGDKTLLDTLLPAREAYHAAVASGDSFAAALGKMVAAAEAGKESTRDMVARIGRASRLGERSRGHLDAGATSCWLILRSLTESMTALAS